MAKFSLSNLLKMPKIRFGKKKAMSDTAPEISEILSEDDSDVSEEDRVASGLVDPAPPPSPKQPLLSRIISAFLGRPGQIAVLTLILVGVGTVGYWLQSHAKDTVARREIAIPVERIALIPDKTRAVRMAEIEARKPKPVPKEMMEAAKKKEDGSHSDSGAEGTAVKTDAEGKDDGKGELASASAEGTAAPVEPPPEVIVGAGPYLVPELVEETPQGFLPKMTQEGLKPLTVYARPFNENDPRPRIAIIITNLGLSSAATEAAIQDLPGEVSLAFQPYANRLDEWIPLARAAGHEVLLSLPMEPSNYPESDPGPKTLLVNLSKADNLDRLDWALSRFTGYVGVVNYLGDRFSTSEEALAPILSAVRDRGLLFIDSRASSNSLATQVAQTLNMVNGFNDRFIDDEPNRWSIDQRLQELERIARRVGFAVGVGHSFPVTLERVRSWATTLPTRGLALAPITAVVDKQEVLN